MAVTWQDYDSWNPSFAEDAALARLERLAVFLDSALRVPGTGIRFGADAALGLVPGVGNLVSTLLSGWILREAWGLGAPPALILRMIGNIAVDSLVTAVPVAGNETAQKLMARRRSMLGVPSLTN